MKENCSIFLLFGFGNGHFWFIYILFFFVNFMKLIDIWMSLNLSNSSKFYLFYVFYVFYLLKSYGIRLLFYSKLSNNNKPYKK